MALGPASRGGDMKGLAWALTALVAGIIAAFRLSVGPKLEAFAGGLPFFDTRFTGYSVAEARAYLTALPPDGVAYYLGVFHPLDFAFPAALALWLWLPLRGAMGAGRLLWLAPLIYALCDYAENICVRVLLQSPVTDGFITLVSVLTQTKWLFALISLALTVWAWTKARQQARHSGLR